MLLSNVRSQPGLLSVAIAMLCHRVAGTFATHEDKERFDARLGLVGVALTSLQNCSEKPPLSNGYQYIKDQMELIRLPSLVDGLFTCAGYKPEIDVPCEPHSSTFIALQHLFKDQKIRSGITFNLYGGHSL